MCQREDVSRTNGIVASGECSCASIACNVDRLVIPPQFGVHAHSLLFYSSYSISIFGLSVSWPLPPREAESNTAR